MSMGAGSKAILPAIVLTSPLLHTQGNVKLVTGR